MSDYLTFEEACALLNTPRSTLYRWLKEDKIPGHKLGRQWRFLRSELDAFVREDVNDNYELEDLIHRLTQPKGDQNMNTPSPSIKEISEQLIWHAVDQQASVIHLSPRTNTYQLKHRRAQGISTIDELSLTAFGQLDEHWVSASRSIRREEKRRLFLERQTANGAERIHVRYQKLETFAGEHLALHLIRENKIATSIDMITHTVEEQMTLERWSKAHSGLILIAGRSGSGKTTTAYCMLQEIAKRDDRVVFTIEDSVDFTLNQVNQVSVDLNNEIEYRRAFVDIIDSDLDVLFISSNFAQRHLTTLWGSALSAAESGRLVLVQIEADSAKEARTQFAQATKRSIDDHLVGVVWQSLSTDPNSHRRTAQYNFLSGSLDQRVI